MRGAGLKAALTPAVNEFTAFSTRLASELALVVFDFLQSNPSDLMHKDSAFLSKPVRPLPLYYSILTVFFPDGAFRRLLSQKT
jgi:hypothetical protein